MNQSKILLAPLFSGALLFLANGTAQGGSATWNLNPTSGDWNTAANWTPATVPNGLSDIATFDASNITSVSLSSSVTPEWDHLPGRREHVHDYLAIVLCRLPDQRRRRHK